MDSKAGRQRRILFFAFATVAFGFIVATVYANWRTLDMLIQTRDVATNGVPSIEHLVAAKRRTGRHRSCQRRVREPPRRPARRSATSALELLDGKPVCAEDRRPHAAPWTAIPKASRAMK